MVDNARSNNVSIHVVILPNDFTHFMTITGHVVHV